MLRTDLHIHSMASGDAYNTPFELVKAAAEKKVETIALTEHGPAIEHAPHVQYFKNIHRFPRNLFGVNVLVGCEANLLDLEGGIDLPADVQKNLDIVLLGIHNQVGYPGRTATENTAALIRAIEKNRIHIITHPGEYRFPVDLKVLFQTAQFCGTLLEINLSILRKSQDFKNFHQLIDLAIQSGGKIIISSDAHVTSEVGDDEPLQRITRMIPDANVLGRTGGHQEIVDFLLTKERQLQK